MNEEIWEHLEILNVSYTIFASDLERRVILYM